MTGGPRGGSLPERIRERIHREGPLPFDRYMATALYDPIDGFFAHGGAGRSGRDFVTSVETGSLFGAMVARALDGWWRELGEPDPFVVVEVGAGRGVLAREVLRAGPACATALRYVLVEQSEALRSGQRVLLPIDDPASALGPGVIDDLDDGGMITAPGTGPIVTALDALPAARFSGVVFANELLDNLPFEIVEAGPSGWHEVRVGLAADGAFCDVLVPLGERMAEPVFHALPAADAVPTGTRLPVATGLRTFLAEVAGRLRRGVVACLDYAEAYDELVRRDGGWLRTFRAQAAAGSPLLAPGTKDITADVPLEAFADAARAYGFTAEPAVTQGEWLRSLGIDEVADDAAASWRERSGVGDLAALAARSRVHEADALTDPSGLGGFRLLLAHKR